VVAAFYYLRLLRAMWFEAPVGATDKPSPDAGILAVGAALFTLPLVLAALNLIDTQAHLAAAAFGLN